MIGQSYRLEIYIVSEFHHQIMKKLIDKLIETSARMQEMPIMSCDGSNQFLYSYNNSYRIIRCSIIRKNMYLQDN